MGLELADIVRRYGPAYRDHFGARLLPSHRRALRAIAQCRTPALGGQVVTCAHCNHVEYRYHSCRNQHCPKCQHGQAEQWLAAQQACLLPVPYCLLTFTLPAALRPFAQKQQRRFYDLLFRAAVAATQQLARDPRFIGGQMGLMGVLHTWTRDLRSHPHVHFLVPAGGLAADHRSWLPAQKRFLLPVKALSKLFRAHCQRALTASDDDAHWPARLWSQPWVVHCKPVGSGQTALKYLAPYVFRVALSNRRLVKLENDRVTFRYTDARSQHVLPKGFVKVRYYGLFSPAHRTQLATLRQRLTASFNSLSVAGVAAEVPAQVTPPPFTVPLVPARCPVCGGPLQVRPLLRTPARCPP
ncbi:MAG: IS91 family transposase [Anaerolineales bacterium]